MKYLAAILILAASPCLAQTDLSKAARPQVDQETAKRLSEQIRAQSDLARARTKAREKDK